MFFLFYIVKHWLGVTNFDVLHTLIDDKIESINLVTLKTLFYLTKNLIS